MCSWCSVRVSFRLHCSTLSDSWIPRYKAQERTGHLQWVRLLRKHAFMQLSTNFGKSIPTTAYQTFIFVPDCIKLGRACSSDFSHSSASVYYTEHKPKNKKRGRPGNEARSGICMLSIIGYVLSTSSLLTEIDWQQMQQSSFFLGGITWLFPFACYLYYVIYIKLCYAGPLSCILGCNHFS